MDDTKRPDFSAHLTLKRGSRLGVYEIRGPLGAGGMGLVLRARDTRLGREVAIKVLYAEAARDEKRLRRLVGEARAASALNHPNIVTVFEMGESERGPYIVTELVEGDTIRSLVMQGPLPPSLALDVAIQTLAGLSKAHEIGLVHRDLKPENLMVSRDGFVKILDFGVAKLTARSDDPRSERLRTLGVSLTEQGVIVGTAAYMSPEQVRRDALTGSSDLFSVAVVLYEMLTGRHPFLRSSAADTMTAILRDEPEPIAGAAPELAAVLAKSLQKDPSARYANAREMELALRTLRRSIDSAEDGATAGLPVLRMQTPERASESAPKVPYSVDAAPARRRRIFAALAVLAAAVGVAIYVRVNRPDAIDAVAVLPFASGETETEYLSEGITESLTNSLSQVAGLKVVPRTVARRFRGQDADLQKVGKELNVGALLTGRVARRGDQLVVQAELVEVAGGVQLWGGQFNRPMSGVLEVQEAIATQITEKLRGRLSGAQKSQVIRHATRNTEAYQLYLKGRYSWNKRTEAGLRTAIAYFDEAIAKDPGYALAYAGLADSYLLLGTYGLMPPREASPRAEAAAKRAIELDPNLGEAHASLGTVRLNSDWNPAEAEQEFRRAIALNPGYAGAHYGLGLSLLALDRFPESRAALGQAQELDPVSLIIGTAIGMLDLHERQYDLAIRDLQATVALDPTFPEARIFLGLAYFLTSRHAEAVAELERATAAMPPEAILIRAYAASVAGNESETLRNLEEFKALSRERGVSSFHAATLYAAIGKKDDAIAWLERAYADRFPEMVYLSSDPMFLTLHEDPRFEQLLRRVETRAKQTP